MRQPVVNAVVVGGSIAAVLLKLLPATYRLWRQARSIGKIQKAMNLTLEDSRELASALVADMREGLKRDVETGVLMLPSFVTRTPTGQEVGTFYALDCGGTNFRVMSVELGRGGGEVLDQTVHNYEIPTKFYKSPISQLFAFMADRFHDSLLQRGGALPAGELRLGFCFSFAVDQTALNAGTLMRLSKGFTCDGAVGCDPVALLRQALAARGIPANVAALVNDSVGVLAACRYADPTTAVGVILGTGFNGCYVEAAERVAKWRPPEGVPPGTATMINIEWGAWDSPLLPRCAPDFQVDAASANPGDMVFEKMLSGKYLGLIAGKLLEDLAITAGLFTRYSRSGRLDWGATFEWLSTTDMARIDEDASWGLHTTGRIVSEVFEIPSAQVSYADLRAVKRVCALVRERAAKLVAAAAYAALEQSGAREGAGVGFDGGVYEHYPSMRRGVEAELQRLTGQPMRLSLCSGGSCLGAAVLAAAATGHS